VNRRYLIRFSPRFVTAFQNRVVQIGRVRLARVKFHNHPFVFKIHGHVLHAVYFHQHGPQFSHALVAIFAFGCDLNGFDNRVIGPLRIMWVARFGIVWSGWVHHLLNARGRLRGRLARDRFEHTPGMVGENFLAGRVGMDAVWLIQERIAADVL
jgi:hypothetical protein